MSLKPFCFEPNRQDIDETTLETTTVTPLAAINYEERSTKKSEDWCLCKKCTTLKSDRECICCLEFDNLSKLYGKEKCITDTPSFQKVIMDEDILNITRQQMIIKTHNSKKKKMLSIPRPQNKTWRFVCYKQFIHWINSWTAIDKGKSNTGKETKIVTKESIKSDEIDKKIVVLQSEEEKAKDIWLEEEIVVAPEALDVISDSRTRPEYNVKYQQYVGTEDTFLQMGPKTPLTSSCEAMVIDVQMPGDRMPDICTDVTNDAVNVRSPKYRLHVPFPHNVHKQMSKAVWNIATSTLTITVFLKRDLDSVNF